MLLAGCGDDGANAGIVTDIPFQPDGIVDFLSPDSALITRIAVEIAREDSARARGLMQRRKLPSRGGMLFIDESPKVQEFWMENTPIPLDMIFVDEEGVVLNVERARPYSRETVYSAGPARYNVEVRSGFAERHNIGAGTLMRWRSISE